MALLAMALAIVGVACSGPLDEDAAIAAAVEASGFRDPISVVEVEAGEAGKLYTGPRGSVMATDQQAIDRARERASRPAWRVVLTGVRRTKSGEFIGEFIIDRDTGAVLYGYLRDPP